MAGMDAKRRNGVARRILQRARHFGGKVLELRLEARLGELARPENFRAERAELGAASALDDDQGRAEERGPFLDQIPRVAVRDAGGARRDGQLAALLDRVEQREQRQVELALVGAAKAPDRTQSYGQRW